MKIKNYLLKVFSLIIFAFILISCVRSNDWQTPPITCTNKFDAPTMTMAAFVAMAPASSTVTIPAGGTPVIFDAYVISTDENGNFYKTISFQDQAENPTVGLQMEVDRISNYADFPVGSHIRIKANGLILGTDHGVKKLGSTDPTYPIGRIPDPLFSRYISGVCNGQGMEIVSIKPTELPNLSFAKNAKYINTLVTVKNVQFSAGELGKTYLNYVAGAGVDTTRKIEDKSGKTSVIKNSGFFTGGKTLVPSKSGTIIFVVSKYNTTWQMLTRSLQDVNFESSRF